MARYRILDLDGCIADDRWRRCRIRMSGAGHAKYHNYHMLSAFDSLANCDLVRTAGDIIVMTGRNAEYRVLTAEWLTRNNVDFHLLLMRPNADFRKAPELKRAMVLEGLSGKYKLDLADIECCFDDREDIVEMYRSLGLRAEVRGIE